MRYENTPANQPSPGCNVLLKQWPNMFMPYRYLMTYHLPKSCGKCVALHRLKLGTLRWCYHYLWMRQLVTVKKIITFFIDKIIFHELWKSVSRIFRRGNSTTDHSDLKFSDISSYISSITSLSHLYLFMPYFHIFMSFKRV